MMTTPYQSGSTDGREHPDAPPAEAGGAERVPLVGVGAGAGGMRGLIGFLRNLPTDACIAYLVVAPRALGRRTTAYHLLRQAAAIPLVEAADEQVIEADHVYIAPPGCTLTAVAGALRVVSVPADEQATNILDHFFTALAASQAAQAVAVLLSGKGVDGVAGLKAVKSQGGWTLAEAPDEAEQPALPRRAIAAGAVDTVAAAGELAELVVRRVGVLAEGAGRDEGDAEALATIIEQILAETGHDFGPYKHSMLLRRIARRMQISGVAGMAAYAQLLRTNSEQTRLLYQDCLVSVTNFFRDADAFDMLERDCIPQLFNGKSRQDAVRVWVAGCATGEEAYSIAMLLSEQAERAPDPPRLQVFATDVDEEAIAFARRGLYPRAIAEDITPARLDRFFVREEEQYRVKDEIREMVLFAIHNVIKDPPFSRLDLLSCRNLLIYFNRDTQEKILELFHYALQPEGYLFLGTAESAETSTHLFTIRNKRCHLYQRRVTGSALARHIPTTISTTGGVRPLAATTRPAEPRSRSVEELYQAWSLRRYAPPRLLIDERYEITHLFGGAERYLREREGAVTHNILHKVLPELRLDLRAALYQALTKGERTISRRLQVGQGNGERLVQMEVGPVDEPGFPKNQIEIVFREQDAPTARSPQHENGADPDQNSLVDQLEEELQRTRERLQTIIEEHQIANQELTASNEELQSINEELKSTSEELEISKEELQSMNEELVTANFELKLKLDELSRANSDLLNFMSATEVGVIFLDRALRIKRFTPPAAELFHLIDADIGRPLAHISHRLPHQRLVEQAAHVLETVDDEEVLVQSDTGSWYIARLIPYRTIENQVDGVVLTFVDITDLKRAEQEVQQRIQQQVVAELGRMALLQPELQPLMDAATARAASVLGVEFSQVLALQPGGASFLLHAGHGWPPGIVGQTRVPADLRTQAGYTLHVGEPVIVPDARRENRFNFAPHLVAAGAQSGLTVLIPGTGRPYGVLGVYSKSPHEFTSYDADFLESVANMLGAAIARTRAEEQIHFQARLLEAVEQAVITTDLEGKVITWNRFAELLYGWQGEEAIGRSILELTLPPDQREAAQAILQQVSKGESWAGEFTLQRRNGERFPAYVTDSPIYSEAGDLIGIIGVSFDISERKQAEQTLREREQRFRQLADAMPQIVWVSDAQGEVTYLNQRWLDYTGMSYADSLQPGGVQTAIHPADLEEFRSAWEQTIQAGAPFEGEMRLRDANGAYRWHLVRSVPVRNETGAVVSWFGTSTDIHDRVRVEHDRQLLSELDAQFRTLDDPDTMIWAAVSHLAHHLEAMLCSFAEVDLAGGQVYLHRDWRHGEPGPGGTFSLDHFLAPELAAAAQQGQTLVIADTATDPRTADRHAAGRIPLNVRSALMAPMSRNGVWSSLLIVAKADPYPWRADEIALVEAVSSRLWAAVEKVRAEQALRASEAELRIITDTVPGLIAYIDADERYRFVNATYARWFDRPEAEIIGRRVAELLSEEAYRRAWPFIQAVLDGETVSYENEMTYATGRKTVLATYVPDRGDDGTVHGFYALITDITERKRAERNQVFLSALMAQISLLAEPDEIMRVASTALGGYLDAYRCHFTQIDLETNQATVLLDWRRPEATSMAGAYPLAPLLTPELLDSLKEGQSIAVEDVQTDLHTAAFAGAYAQFAVRSFVAAPYIQIGRWVGLLVVQCAEPRPWLADEVNLVTATMERVWPVVERAHSTRALRQSEERYRALIENAGEAIFVANQEGVYIEVNPSACALLGYSQDELLGKTITDLLPPADHERLASARVLLASGEAHLAEWDLLHKDGAHVPVEISAKILPDGRWQAFVRDITQRKRAEQTLRFLADASVALASSLDYEVTLDTVARLAVPHIADWCAIDLVNEDGQIESVGLAHVDPAKVAWAQELRARYPVDPNAPAGAPQVIRSGQSEFYPDIPDELLQQAAKNEEELELLRSVGYRSVMVVPLAARGRIFGAMTFVATESRINFTESDLTMAQEVARRAAVAIDNALLFRAVQQSEQQLRTSEELYQRQLAELELVYRTAPVGLAVLDTELRYLRANETLARMKGISVADHLGKTGRELLPSLAAQLDERLKRVLATGEPVVDLEISVEPPAFPDEERIWMESLYPLRSPDGKIIAINAVVQDITERKRQEAELKALNEMLEVRVAERTAELERSNRELDQFAYVASHDLKAPLRAISQLASWTLEDAAGQVPTAAQEHLEKLQIRVKRMSVLLDDLLTYSRAGRLHHAPERVDTAALIHDVVETLAPPQSFRVKIEGEMPVVHTERVPLEMVLRNLVGNAIKHHHRVDGQVSVAVRTESDQLIFTVADDGPGIDPQFHTRIFELFQTLQPRDRVEGSGMGLAIVKRIIENRGGAIRLESAPGQGAKFHFTWPLENSPLPR